MFNHPFRVLEHSIRKGSNLPFMKKIPLTKGLFALVDDSDFEWLSQWKWQARRDTNTFYADRTDRSNPLKRKTVSMHRAIMRVDDPSMNVDHIDHNGLNNTRENLRICTPAQNARNQKTSVRNTTGFKGVYKRGDRFIAAITVNWRCIYLGTFDSAEEAARHYNQAAVQHFSEFACLNDVNPKFPTSPRSILRKNTTSGYLGVHLREYQRWAAQIKFNHQKIYLGSFATPEEAARAYDAKARELYGDKARLNFPHESMPICQ